MNLQIGLTGPHGSGKTTLLNDLKSQKLDLTFLPEVTRILKDKGFVINEHGSTDTQLLVLATHIQNILFNKNFIVDRSLIDGYIYTTYLNSIGQVPDWVQLYAKQLCEQYLPLYDYIFYIPAEFNLTLDGTRSGDQAFYSGIKDLFEICIPIFSKCTNIITVTGTREQRVHTIMSTIGA